METQKEKLGKVSITVEEDYWDINKVYKKLTIVERQSTGTTYLSRKPVPAGTSIYNRKYWIKFSKWSDIPYEVVQELGDSPELVISQKVVTEHLTSLNAKIVQEISEEKQRAEREEQAIKNDVNVLEELASISIEGGEIQIGFADDLENPTAAQKAKVATIGAVYDTVLGTKVIVEAADFDVEEDVSRIEIEPNKFYNFRNTITSSVKIYLLPPTDANKENEYKIQFTAGEGAVVEFLNGAIDAQDVRTPILWLNDDPLRAYANTTYQVSVLNNLAVYTGWEI